MQNAKCKMQNAKRKCACVHACMCVRACMHACVSACVRASDSNERYAYIYIYNILTNEKTMLNYCTMS